MVVVPKVLVRTVVVVVVVVREHNMEQFPKYLVLVYLDRVIMVVLEDRIHGLVVEVVELDKLEKMQLGAKKVVMVVMV